MSNCPGCGGVIGRDCFNTQECIAITQDMANRYIQDENHVRLLQAKYDALQETNEKLTEERDNLTIFCTDILGEVSVQEFDRIVKQTLDFSALKAKYDALKAIYMILKKYLRHTEKCRSKRFNMKERWKCTCGLKEAHAEAEKLWK